MSDNNVGFFQGPMAPMGSVGNGNVRFSNSANYKGQLSTSGITVYPTATSQANGASPQSTTGSEAAIIHLNVPLDMSSFINAHEALFTYPLLQSIGVGRKYNSPAAGITTLSMLNIQLRDDWRAIVRLSRSTEDNDVVRFAKGYIEYGESWFTMGGRNDIFKWANVALVMQNDKYKVFRMASKYGLAMVNFIGINVNGREINSRNPLGQLSSKIAGTIKIRNYWGASAITGHKMGFVYRKESVEGAYQLVPWSSGQKVSLPMSVLTYQDCANQQQISRVITVARCTHPLIGVYTSTAEPSLLGLTDEVQDVTDLSSKISQMSVVESALFTSSRFFV
jgi:hypothetical protein